MLFNYQIIKKMKFQNQLSIKSALRFALPCLASCLLLAACSNEVSDVTPDDLPSETAGTIRFTASAPLASEDVATRIGIGEGKPSVENYAQAEPVIWLGDEEISVFFVSKGDGSEIHAKFKIDDTNISPDGKSADLLNETNLSHLNGDYEIYAFTPYVAENTLSAALLDFSNQVQLPNTTTYAHLGATASMRAAGVTAQFTYGSLISGDVNFNFEHITSFLRFNITNELGEAITVTGISVSHPNMISKSSYSIVDNALSLTNTESAISLSFGGGQQLADKVSFDAYMSTLNVPLTTNINQELEITISVAGREPFDYEVLPSELFFNESTGAFTLGKRYLFEISLTSSSVIDPSDLANATEFDGYYYTYNIYKDELTPGFSSGSDVYFSYGDMNAVCKPGWETCYFETLTNNTDYRISLYDALGPAYRGIWEMPTERYPAGRALNAAYVNLINAESDAFTEIFSKGGWNKVTRDIFKYMYRPICRVKK